MKLTPIKGVFALLVGAIVLKIFFPWWFVTLIIGGATCFAVYKWVTIKTGVSPVWAKRFAGLAIVIFLISLFVTFFETKWPWVAKALDSRQLVISLGIADWLKSKEPLSLRMKMEKLREELMKAEEQKYIKKIEPIEAKIAAGQELTEADQKIIKEAEDKLRELQKKAAGDKPLPQKDEKQNVLQPKQEINVKYLTFRFSVRAGEPSADIFALPKDQCCWANWWGPEETQIINKDGQIMGPLLKEYGIRKEFSEGVRFQSPIDGIVIVFQASRKEDLPSIDRVKEIWKKEQNAYLKTKQISGPPPEPQKPVELAFLGKDCKFLKFEENEHVIRSPNWIIRLVSIQITERGNLRLNFLHTNSKGGRYTKLWIGKPEETTYLVDESGRKIGFVSERNLGTSIDRKGKTVLGGKEFPSGVPIAYAMVFSRLPENVRKLNFVSKYAWGSNYPCYQYEEIVIRGIKLFMEKSQLTEINNPPDEDLPSKVLIEPEAQGTNEKKVAEEKIAEEKTFEQRQEIKKNERQAYEEKKPNQTSKSIGRQIYEQMFRGGQRSQRYPYRR